MTIAVKAIYEHGVFRPVEPVQLNEATEVQVLLPTDGAEDANDPTGWVAMREFIALAQDADSSTASVDHDAILYRR